MSSFITMNYKIELVRFKNYLDDRVQPGTANLYVYSLNRWFNVLNGDELNQESAQSYIDSLARAGKSPSTVSTKAHAIMRYFRWKGQHVSLDCPTIRMGKPEYLTIDEVQEVINACVTPLEKTLVIMLFDSAVRITELLNLELDDVDWDRGLIRVIRKGGRADEVNVSQKALDELAKWLEARKSSSKRIFVDTTYYDCWALMRTLGKRAGVGLRPHLLRHSRAIQMIRAGAPIHIVQQHLGHKTISTTMNIYGMFKPEHLKEEIPDW